MKLHRMAPMALLALAAACSHSMSGKYADRNGLMGVEFRSGTAYVSTLGGTTEVKYRMDGDRIVLFSEQGNLVLTRQSDGSLDGPTGRMTRVE